MTIKNLKSLTILLYFISISLTAQINETVKSDTLELRIKKVENSLSPLVLTKGKPLWNIEEQMKKYNIPGLSITVIKDYKIDWSKGYGVLNSDRNDTITTKTVFQAGSMSKFINALALMKLKEQKNINFDANINSLLNSWQFPYEANSLKKFITLRQLLSHTSGLSMSGFSGYKSSKKLPTTIQILEGGKPANSQKVVSLIQPNKEFKYSGGGTTISQLILSDISNIAYTEYIEKQIFNSIQMENSFYSIQLDKYPKDIANGHTKKGRPLKNRYNIYPESAAAGLWTTTIDLANLLIDFQLSLKDGKGELLSNKSALEMIKPVLENNNSALGLFVEGQKEKTYLQHSAATKGFRGKFYISSENGNGVVIMTNGTNIEVLEEIIRSVAKTYSWSGFETYESNLDINIKNSDLKEYVGTYTTKKREVIVYIKNGKLLIAEKGKWSSKLTAISETSFLVEKLKPTASVEFVKNQNGQITKLIVKQGNDLLEWKKAS